MSNNVANPESYNTHGYRINDDDIKEILEEEDEVNVRPDTNKKDPTTFREVTPLKEADSSPGLFSRLKAPTNKV